MRSNERLKYQEFVDRIQFPMIIFVYETKRVIAINNRGRTILECEKKTLKYIPDPKVMRYISPYIHSEINNIEFDYPVNLGPDKTIRIDFEVNTIKVDDKHIVLCIFDYTDNHSFSQVLSVFVPRLFWKDKLLKLEGANYFCRSDFKGSNILFGDVDTAYSEDVAIKLNQDETLVLETKEPLWNVIQLIQYKNEAQKFICLNRIPIFNKNGTLIGILGGYRLLHNREEINKVFRWVRDEKVRLTKLVSNHNGILFRVRDDEDWFVEYATDNVVKLGYTRKDFFLKEMTMKKLIVEEDVDKVIHSFYTQKKMGKEKIELEYRIRNKDGNKLWVKATVFKSDKSDEKNNTVNFVLEDITQYKKLQKELQSSKEALKVKLDTIHNGEFPNPDVHFNDFFQIDEIYKLVMLFSEMIHISCIITDTSGHPLEKMINFLSLPEEVAFYYESKSSASIYRDLYKNVKNGNEPVYYDKKNKIYMYAIPFNVIGKCIAFLNIITYEELSSESKLVQYVTSNVNSVCTSVQKNYELLKQRESTEEVKNKLTAELDKSELFGELLTIALAEQNLYSALTKVILRLTDYMFVGDILMFRKMEIDGKYVYKKQMEWNANGQVNRRTNQNYEEISVNELSEIIALVKQSKIVCFQKGEIPRCIQRPLAMRRIKSMVVMPIEFEEEKVVLAFCNRKNLTPWSDDTIVFLSRISNIIKVILQRMVEMRWLI